MKLRIVFIGFSLFSVLNCFAQTDTSNAVLDTSDYMWSQSVIYDIDSNEVWAVDGIGNVISSHDGTINKYDTIGTLKFSQSVKSMGRMQQLLPINSMKLVHFSEEQQTLCYLDNTLTEFDDCLELADRDVVNASRVASSSRPDLVWVFDDLNSKLLLLSLEGNRQQEQEIDNLGGILDLGNISQIIEKGNRLYIVDEGKGVYIFDLYGSLLEHLEEENLISVDAEEDALFILFLDKLKFIMKGMDSDVIIPLPMGGIVEMAYSNQHFYFRTSTHVHKFRLQFVK